MEEGEQRRGEEMGLTVRQRQAVMNELRAKYAHASKKEKSRILDGFVDLTHLIRSYARSVLRAGGVRIKNHIHRPRASVYKGGGPPCAHGVLASVGQTVWQATRSIPATYHPLPRDPGAAEPCSCCP